MSDNQKDPKPETEEVKDPNQSEETSDPNADLTPEQLRAQLAESQKHIKALNKESAERRKKLEALEKAEAERKQAELSEIEKANAKAKALEDDKAQLAAENARLKLQGAFQSKVRALKLSFVNENAEADAFRALNLETVGEDHTGLEGEIKRIVKEYSYYFGNGTSQTQTFDDSAAKGRVITSATTQEAVAKKRRSIAPL